MLLKSKNIIVGVTGSIAAYKSAFLIRLLVKQGANVKVVMTHSATQFIAPVTLSTLSKNPVLTDFYKSDSGEWNNHVELALWADAYIIAPTSANTLAKMAHGICDNILMATFLSAKCPVFFAPAMDLDMYLHPSTQRNIKTLIEDGSLIIDSEFGELASGLEGKGRMAEPEEILIALNQYFEQQLLSK
jgi:phosphopantothenoylcysteine decarboxylase / phosphopantothenate---cysteine ligase